MEQAIDKILVTTQKVLRTLVDRATAPLVQLYGTRPLNQSNAVVLYVLCVCAVCVRSDGDRSAARTNQHELLVESHYHRMHDK